jgi:hypothetical protein
MAEVLKTKQQNNTESGYYFRWAGEQKFNYGYIIIGINITCSCCHVKCVSEFGPEVTRV